MIKSIGIYYREQELGKLGFNEESQKSFFQYNPSFLNNENFKPLFPFLLKKNNLIQSFSNFNSETFKNLPPMFADSLPDLFGNMVFKEWMNMNNKTNISPIEQLAYVGVRGMGAIEYKPSKMVTNKFENNISINEMSELSKRILDTKREFTSEGLNHESLLNMFRIGTSAGGARPKILVSEEKKSGKLIPGDISFSKDFNHYLVKLGIDDAYPSALVEYSYYKLATYLGINMQPSNLIDGKHFSTLRFDRDNGEKKHVITASGLQGLDFKSPENSSYENLFKLSNSLGIPHVEIESLFKRMVFNVVYLNIDDHLKNHSFILDDKNNKWNLSPAYDITFAFNPLLKVTNINRALSINEKRKDINTRDLFEIADRFSIKNAKRIVDHTLNNIEFLKNEFAINKVPIRISSAIINAVSLNIKNVQKVTMKKNSGYSL